jgi:hypothetical protein
MIIKIIDALNTLLGRWENLVDITGVIISVIALIVSIIALRSSTYQADLYLKYQVYGEEDFINGVWHENGEGMLLLDSEDEIEGEVGEKIVTRCRPGGEVELIFENRGKVAAKNPIINFTFSNMGLANELLESNVGWKGITHNHGIGTWSEIRWQPTDNTVIHPGIPVSFKNFYFNGSEVCDEAYIEVIISADNAKSKKFKIPVIIR